jgi:hypothetical protein
VLPSVFVHLHLRSHNLKVLFDEAIRVALNPKTKAKKARSGWSWSRYKKTGELKEVKAEYVPTPPVLPKQVTPNPHFACFQFWSPARDFDSGG